MFELKPCPFCGGGHIEIFNQGSMPDDPHVVQCDDCDASAFGMSMSEAIAAWNRRSRADMCCLWRNLVCQCKDTKSILI